MPNNVIIKMTALLLTVLYFVVQKSFCIKVIESKDKSDTGRAMVKDLILQVLLLNTITTGMMDWNELIRITQSSVSVWGSTPPGWTWQEMTSLLCSAPSSPSPAWSLYSTGQPLTVTASTLAALTDAKILQEWLGVLSDLYGKLTRSSLSFLLKSKLRLVLVIIGYHLLPPNASSQSEAGCV